MHTNLTNRNFSKQSHLIVNAKYNLTTREINIILTLLTAITKEDIDFKDYQFSLADFNKKTNIIMTSSDLKRAIKGVMNKSIEIGKSSKYWEFFNWFSYFRFKNGIMTCRFDKALKPYLLDIKERFIISDLRMLLQIRSSYSKRIYLLLKEYGRIGSRRFELSELQETLKIKKSMALPHLP